VIAGHFGFAAFVKSREHQAPLWALMLATVWLDIVFVPLFLAGVETIEPLAGARGSYGTGIIYADYTHSLVGSTLLSMLLGLAAAARWGRRTGAVVGLVAFSHWVLDLMVHRADMPLLPANAGSLPRFGFGLWRFPIASATVEFALVAVGAWTYWRATREITLAAGQGRYRAALVTALILIGGTVVLAVDFTGTAT
jgi:membrane-bound metal-dependent hydrolase YbcI (DUF457 family)